RLTGMSVVRFDRRDRVEVELAVDLRNRSQKIIHRVGRIDANVDNATKLEVRIRAVDRNIIAALRLEHPGRMCLEVICRTAITEVPCWEPAARIGDPCARQGLCRSDRILE